MLKLYRVTKVKVLLLVLVYVFSFNLFEFSAAILEKGLLVGVVKRNPVLLTMFGLRAMHFFWERPAPFQSLTWLVGRTKNKQQNNAPNPKKQCGCKLSGSRENRDFERYRSTVSSLLALYG